MSEKDGGPAFPTDCATTHGYALHEHGGMSLRAYIATAMMKGIVTADYAGDFDPDQWAHNAVHLADALLAELAK